MRRRAGRFGWWGENSWNNLSKLVEISVHLGYDE